MAVRHPNWSNISTMTPVSLIWLSEEKLGRGKIWRHQSWQKWFDAVDIVNHHMDLLAGIIFCLQSWGFTEEAMRTITCYRKITWAAKEAWDKDSQVLHVAGWSMMYISIQFWVSRSQTCPILPELDLPKEYMHEEVCRGDVFGNVLLSGFCINCKKNDVLIERDAAYRR